MLCKSPTCKEKKLINSAYCLSCHKEERRVVAQRKVDEREFVKQQETYISQLHAHTMVSADLMRSSMKAIMAENGEMMKIIAASTKRMRERSPDYTWGPL